MSGCAPKQSNPDRWCFATSPNGKKCLGTAGHDGDHAAYGGGQEPFEVWPQEADR